MFVSMRTFLLLAISVFVLAPPALAQQEGFFFDSLEAADTVLVFDTFSGNYTDVQTPGTSTGAGSGQLVIGGTPPNPFVGGFINGGDLLYTHDAVDPTFDISLTGLVTSGANSSVVIQFATTETTSTLTSDRFSIAGVGGPDEFIFLGSNGSVPFGSSSFDMNFYWAEWNGLANTSTLDATIEIDDFRVVGGAKVMHFNSDSALNISQIAAVPEPATGLVMAVGAIALGLRRRRFV